MLFKNQPKTISTSVAGFITNGAGLKTEARNTNQLGPKLKRLTKFFKTSAAKVYFCKIF